MSDVRHLCMEDEWCDPKYHPAPALRNWEATYFHETPWRETQAYQRGDKYAIDRSWFFLGIRATELGWALDKLDVAMEQYATAEADLKRLIEKPAPPSRWQRFIGRFK